VPTGAGIRPASSFILYSCSTPPHLRRRPHRLSVTGDVAHRRLNVPDDPGARKVMAPSRPGCRYPASRWNAASGPHGRGAGARGTAGGRATVAWPDRAALTGPWRRAARAKSVWGTICKGGRSGRAHRALAGQYHVDISAAAPRAHQPRPPAEGRWSVCGGTVGAWRWSLSARALYPHPHRRGPQPRAEARAAYGPSADIDGGAAGPRPRRRRAEGATLAELACSYGVGRSTIPGCDEAPRPLDLVSGAAKKRRSR
jgi:hypothetical protein